jgi:hypothetical protein
LPNYSGSTMNARQSGTERPENLPMLALNGLKTANLLEVEPGHLILLKSGLAIRAIEPFLTDVRRQPINLLVFLEAGKAPLASPLREVRRKCIDLGAPEIRASADLGIFSLDPQHSRPGTVAIDDEGAWIICQETENNQDSWLRLATGKVGPLRTDPWYVLTWSLGIRDAEGEFWPMYSRVVGA